ncbi:MAG: CheR family methyltransferase, partial [Chloroflexota bacterium]
MSDLETLFQLVVIGASAGGIEALSKLVTTLPSSFPVPIVIAQHLDPNRPSHLGEILTRQSSLPVVTVWEHVVLQPGTIYVVPSNRHVQITDHEVAILPGEMGEGRSKPSINLLLSSAAEVYGEKLIAVILTGTGTDGTAGAETVNLLGGTVLIQDPATAAYPGMPRSLASQSVDIVADLDRIGTILVNLVTGIPVATQFHQSSQPVELENELQPFLNQVREHSGLDFRSYKPATILRRLQRRIATTETVNLQGYLKYLEAHPEEYQQLISNFLIKVTEFMRDPELFNYLREHLLPELVTTSQTQGNELRIWSAGCATGEEAYSLAILVGEVLGNQLEHFTIKIFATDLDPDAIAFARRGIYPATALARLPEKWVTGSFTRHQNGNYEIKKWIRNLLVFGEHDLGQHAPFPRLDLVVCRNVLIYFSKEYQQHILHRFAFALREGGYLVLGRTEAINSLPELFVPPLTTQYPHKIYRRQGSQQLFLPNLGSISGATLLDKDQKVNRARSYRFATRDLFQVQQKVQQARVAREDLLLKLPVGVVVVNQRFDIQEINNAARRLLGIHTPAIGED